MEPIRSVARAAAIVEVIAQGGPAGARLTDIVGGTGLQKTTAHRLLATLVSLGWVEQDAATSAFHLALPFVGFGTVSLNRHGLLDIANPRLTRLSEETGDTAYLSVRRGVEALCVDRVTGSFPIRTLTLKVGDRRPLGVGSGSLALLAWLPDAEVERILGLPRPTSPLTHTLPSLTALRRSIQQARQLGYVVNRGGVVPGAVGVAVPVAGPDKSPLAALGVAGIESRLDDDRIAQVAELLREEADRLGADLARVAPHLTEPTIRHLLAAEE